MKPTKLCSALIVVLFLISGCSSTVIDSSWKNPDFSGQVKRVYIIGISKQDLTRKIFEDDFHSQLEKYGVVGIRSYPDLPIDKNFTKEEIEKNVSSNGVDAVMLSRVIGERKEAVTAPGIQGGTSHPVPNSRYSNNQGYYPDPYSESDGSDSSDPYSENYGSYFDRSWKNVYQPGTVAQYQILTIEANLYDASTAELIWSAQLETVVQGNLQSLIDGFVEKVTKDLNEKGLI